MESQSSPQDPYDSLEDEASLQGTSTAELNQTIIQRLERALKENPEVDLLSVFPWFYKKRFKSQRYSGTEATASSNGKSKGRPPRRLSFCTRLVSRASKASIIFPLSSSATTLLDKYMNAPTDPTLSLLPSLKRMISESEKLWEFPTRGVVLKCNEELVAKIIGNDGDYTEYTSLQYLAENAPDIPAPKPHGLVLLDNFRIMFMTYFPSMTLEQAWPKLNHDNKVLIQHQLNNIFMRLRTLKKESGQRLGGLGGEGVKDNHREPHQSNKVMKTNAEFEDFQFSVPHRGNASWIKFLRSLLPVPSEGSVFTHGDVRTANVMVDINHSKNYVVTGIIDWEYSGFYPDYHESARILFTFNMHSETDWYTYLPDCIAPARHPERWLVGRLWDQCINFS